MFLHPCRLFHLHESVTNMPAMGAFTTQCGHFYHALAGGIVGATVNDHPHPHGRDIQQLHGHTVYRR